MPLAWLSDAILTTVWGHVIEAISLVGNEKCANFCDLILTYEKLDDMIYFLLCGHIPGNRVERHAYEWTVVVVM